eukprot:gene13284-9125_t
MSFLKKLKNKLAKTDKKKHNDSSDNSEALGSVPSESGSIAIEEVPATPMSAPPLTPDLRKPRESPPPQTPPLQLSKIPSTMASLSESLGSLSRTPSKGLKMVKLPPGLKIPPGAKKMTGKAFLASGAVRPPLQMDGSNSELRLTPVPSMSASAAGSRRGSFFRMGPPPTMAGDDLQRQNSLGRSVSSVGSGRRMMPVTAPLGVKIESPRPLSRRDSKILSEDIQFQIVPTPQKPAILKGLKKMIIPPGGLSKTFPGSGKQQQKVIVGPGRPPKQEAKELEEIKLESEASSSSSLEIEVGSPLSKKADTPLEMSISLSSNGQQSATFEPEPSVLTSRARRQSSEGGRSSFAIEAVPPKTHENFLQGAPTRISSSNVTRASSVALVAPPQPVSKEGRRRIIEQFSVLLSPHQYYGKVLKVKDIQSINSSTKWNAAEFELGEKENRIYVATKDADACSRYYPQLRLYETDAAVFPNAHPPTAVETRITIHEAIPGRMVFSSTELNGSRLLDNPHVSSCFVTSSSHILFKDTEKRVSPIAKLTIVWIPYSSPQSEPQCPVHQKEMQLFDPYTRKLVCALCAAKQPSTLSKLVVIPDVLTPHSRVNILESLSRQLDGSRRNLDMWVAQHERVMKMSNNKKNAILEQFTLLMSAIESKKREFLEACDAEFDYALIDVAKEILTTTEKIEVLSAANQHLESGSTLHSLQIATIAEGVESSKVFPSKFSKGSLRISSLSTSLMPKLDGVMAQVHALNPNVLPIESHKSRGRAINSRSVPEDDIYLRSSSSPQNAAHRLEDGEEDWARCRRSSSMPSMRVRCVDGPGGERQRNSSGVEPFSPSRQPLYGIPNSSGSAVFDYSLHHFLSALRHVGKSGPREKCIQFGFRVDDYGDWVGIGVGVGVPIDTFADAGTSDLSHLWIVPYGAEGETYILRIHEHCGHGKLSVHDRRGKQLDDGRIPRWKADRPCYPQVTFGGKIGHVELVETPHVIQVIDSSDTSGRLYFLVSQRMGGGSVLSFFLYVLIIGSFDKISFFQYGSNFLKHETWKGDISLVMPIFGVDDVVFLIVSTSMLLWAKRGEVAQQLKKPETGNDSPSGNLVESKAEVYLRRTYSTTPFLLPGFNLSNATQPQLSSQSLIQQSRLGAAVPDYSPCVPHRQYNVYKQIPQVSSLTSSTEHEVAASLGRYTSAQVAALFRDMEAEGLWESVLRVSKGISIAHETMKFLPQTNIERSIKTLLDAHRVDEAVDYYFEYGKDILLSDELLLLLFDGCRFSRDRSLLLYEHVLPFQSRWTEVNYACCLTVTAKYDPPKAVQLYHAYAEFLSMERAKEEKPLHRLLNSSVLLQESGLVRNRPVSKLRNLYHIMVPLAAEHFPAELDAYIKDMMRSESESAPDVFLKCLLCSSGRPLVEPYVRDYVSRHCSATEVKEMTVASLAVSLYSMRPSAMNMNSLLSVFIQLETSSVKEHRTESSTLTPPWLAPLQTLLAEVPLDDTHARVLSRTITEQRASWALASLFTNSMLQRQHYSVIPSLSRHLSRIGKWSAAATAMTIYMSNRRSRFSPVEVGMCIEACMKSGRWSSALFWVDRASSAGVQLPPHVYDTVLRASDHVSWDHTAKMLHSIRRVGGSWTDKGYLQLEKVVGLLINKMQHKYHLYQDDKNMMLMIIPA